MTPIEQEHITELENGLTQMTAGLVKALGAITKLKGANTPSAIRGNAITALENALTEAGKKSSRREPKIAVSNPIEDQIIDNVVKQYGDPFAFCQIEKETPEPHPVVDGILKPADQTLQNSGRVGMIFRAEPEDTNTSSIPEHISTETP
jgi:hypothetical protein